MNMTYARAKYRHTPKAKGKMLAAFPPPSLATLNERAMVVPSGAGGTTVIPPKQRSGPHAKGPNRARRHRLNPGRRTVEQNRAAR